MTLLFTVASFNIQYSLGADGVYDMARCLDAVRDADVICLQEVDRFWRRTGMVDQVAEIEALMPDRHSAFGAALDADASELVAGRVVNRRRQGGQMVLSRWPIASSRMHPLPKDDTGEAFNCWCGSLETVVVTPAGPVRVLNVHLTDITESNRIRQTHALVQQLTAGPIEGGSWNGTSPDPEEVEHWQFDDPQPPMPAAAVVAGDFNDVPDSTVVQALLRAGLRHTWTPQTAPDGYDVTFKTNPPQGTFEDMRIDYIFVSGPVRALRARIDGDCIASDHQPVWAWLELDD